MLPAATSVVRQPPRSDAAVRRRAEEASSSSSSSSSSSAAASSSGASALSPRLRKGLGAGSAPPRGTQDSQVDDDFEQSQLVERESASASASTAVAPASSVLVAAPVLRPIIQNVVATVNLALRPLDLKDIALRARNAEYNPKKFAAVIIRIREPKTTALVFSSGKVVVTGAKDETDSKLAAKKFAGIIRRLEFPVKFTEFKVQNIVASCDVRFPIRLEGLAFTHNHFCTYEPELFPGLVYRMVEPKVVLLIFVSGKVVLTGAKSRGDIQAAFDNIYPVLVQFRKSV